MRAETLIYRIDALIEERKLAVVVDEPQQSQQSMKGIPRVKKGRKGAKKGRQIKQEEGEEDIQLPTRFPISRWASDIECLGSKQHVIDLC